MRAAALVKEPPENELKTHARKSAQELRYLEILRGNVRASVQITGGFMKPVT